MIIGPGSVISQIKMFLNNKVKVERGEVTDNTELLALPEIVLNNRILPFPYF